MGYKYIFERIHQNSGEKNKKVKEEHERQEYKILSKCYLRDKNNRTDLS